MPERRVAQVVGHGSRFYNFGMNSDLGSGIFLGPNDVFGEAAAHLRDLVGVLLPCVENVELTSSDNLRYPR